MTITLKDNNLSSTFNRHDIADLFPIGDKPIRKMIDENRNLLVFPHCINKSYGKIHDEVIFNTQCGTNTDEVIIKTGNVMGFVGRGKTRLKIASRFDAEANRSDFFLHYMLQRIFTPNIFDLSHNHNENDVIDFLLLMFPYFLNNALHQGVFKEYRRFQHNDSRVKGPINIARHIKENVPFVVQIAYSTRQHTHDNHITQLIRHTIELIQTRTLGNAVLKMNRETIDAVNLIKQLTPSYHKSERRLIVQKNLRPIAHPYYTEYTPLQSLCLSILRWEKLNFEESDNEISGLLFDGAWLWEEYVNTIIKDLGFIHPDNKEGKEAIYLFISNKYPQYPDFYKKNIVLDAKYKFIDKGKDSDDMHQVICYMYILQAMHGGLIYPLSDSTKTTHKINSLNGYGGTFNTLGLSIDKEANDYSVFCKQMMKAEETLIKNISTIIT